MTARRGPAPTTFHDLLLYSSFLDDVENARIRNANRLQAITTEPVAFFGQGFDPATVPELGDIESLNAELQKFETVIVRRLEKIMAAHPLGPWMQATIGVGAKQLARLLGTIGDPADRPSVQHLWSYCGLSVWKTADGHGTAPRMVKGRQSSYNPEARKRVWLIADSCVKQLRSPYRVTYDKGRAKYALATHTGPCAGCGPKGTPALAGSELSDGHQDNRARRLMMKEILKDLWVVSRKIRETA